MLPVAVSAPGLGCEDQIFLGRALDQFPPLSIMAAHSRARGGLHRRSLTLPVVVLMLVKEAGNLLLQHCNLT
jgi:hypothetical protein